MNKKVVRPRQAASLIIYREGRRGLEVLMGCRHSKARFKPGVYVFPGGMLERSDHNVTPASRLNRTYVDAMGVAGSHSRAQALAVAAIRETSEEVGLLVAKEMASPASNNLNWQTFRDAGLGPHLAPLQYVGRAITPSHQPIRFDARFFCVAYEHVRGKVVDNGELTDTQWVALNKCQHLEMMKVTHLMLETLQEKLTNRSAKAPFLYFIRGQKVLKWS